MYSFSHHSDYRKEFLSGFTMFGITDPYIWIGYLLSFLLTAACIAYGILNWRNGQEPEEGPDGS